MNIQKIFTGALLVAGLAHAGNRASDSTALLAIANASGNAGNANATLWKEGTKLNTWTGVTVTNDRVTGLYLAVGTSVNESFTTLINLPSNIGDLDALQSLYIYNSGLTDLHQGMEQLTALTSLTLESNPDMVAVPYVLGDLTSLTTLTILNSKIAQTSWDKDFPATLTKLKTLTITSNKASMTALPVNVTALTSLEMLDLSDNDLSSLPADIGKLVNLKVLSLTDNRLTTLPAEMKTLTKLERLWALGNDFSAIPDGIWKLTSLRKLTLGGDGTSDHILPASLAALKNLDHLSLSSMQLKAFPGGLESLPLVTLDLSNNRIQTVPTTLAASSTLDSMNLAGNYLVELPAAYLADKALPAMDRTNRIALNMSRNYMNATATQAILAAYPKANVDSQHAITTLNEQSMTTKPMALSKTYDGTNGAVVYWEVEGVDTAQVVLKCKGEFAQTAVGSNLTVVATGNDLCALAGWQANIYEFAFQTSYDITNNSVDYIADITKAPLEVSATYETIVKGVTPTLAYTITSGKLFGTDKLTGTLAVDNYVTEGVHIIKQGSLAISANAGNYALSFVDGKLIVTSSSALADATAPVAAQHWNQAILGQSGVVALRSLDGRLLWSANLPSSPEAVRAQLGTQNGLSVLQIGKQHWVVK